MKVCICGTVKNVGQYLTKVMRNMEKIAALFEDYVIILYYDHSNDNTLEILREYCKKNPKLLFYVNKSPLSSFRTHNIAKGRNFCLEKIRTSFNDYEYMIMMDCDEVCTNNIKVEVLKYYLDRESIVLEDGDIIHRHMMDGDAVLFNRQPTLHRMSMMCHIAKIMKRGDTFRMNVADRLCVGNRGR